MASSSTTMHKGESSKVSNNQLICNESCNPPKFKAYPKIAVKGDASRALSFVPHRLILIHDVTIICVRLVK